MLITHSSKLYFLLMMSTFVSCKPKITTDSEANYSGGGLAEYVFYQCKSSTQIGTRRYDYSTSLINNTVKDISIQISETNSPTLDFKNLNKISTDQWASQVGIQVQLKNKKNGQKGIQINDTGIGKSIDEENSFCTVTCAGPTKLQDGRCLWTGITEEDPFGNFAIEFVASLGTSTIFRLATSGGRAAGVALANDTTLRTGAELISKARNYDDAVAQLAKSIEKTNPLSGTKLVGKGNCANDATTQLISLVLGRWACAIPYPQGQIGYATTTRIVSDLTQLIGIKQAHKNVKNLANFADDVLMSDLKEGGVALVFSGAKNAGHMTLIAKVKGKLVHINNQNWKQRFQTVAQWEETWRKSYGKEGAEYSVYTVSRKIIGFN